MGVTFVKRACWPGPVTCLWSSGWVATVLLVFLAAAGLRAVARSGVQLERPEPRSGEDERAGRWQATADDRGARKSLLVIG
jgi:hypothetical protein